MSNLAHRPGEGAEQSLDGRPKSPAVSTWGGGHVRVHVHTRASRGHRLTLVWMVCSGGNGLRHGFVHYGVRATCPRMKPSSEVQLPDLGRTRKEAESTGNPPGRRGLLRVVLRARAVCQDFRTNVISLPESKTLTAGSAFSLSLAGFVATWLFGSHQWPIVPKV